MNYIKVDNFVLKLRAYPTKEQREKIDNILTGIRVAYNVTAYEITNGNPLITNIDKKDESVRWPEFSACKAKEWLDYLRTNYEIVNCIPAGSLSSPVYGIFCVDLKKSWETSKKLPCGKWKPSYYSKKRPRTSFTVQTRASGFIFTKTSKACHIGVTNLGKVKCRGWRDDIRFGEDGPEFLFSEAFDKKKAFGVTVAKDNCGDYWIIVKLQTVWIPDKSSAEKHSLGIDVGIKDLVITSDGEKYENKQFKRQEKRHKRRLNRKLSRRQGWSNIEFRKAHKADKTLQPSKGYEKVKLKNAKLERKIARRRENYNHNVTASIIYKASFIGIEDLNVKGMMANRHVAFSASDAAMSDVLSKLTYKAKWRNTLIVKIGRWEPSSQLCSVCGYQNKAVKNLGVREWTCPQCGTYHDRDINAAINIRNKAMEQESEK